MFYERFMGLMVGAPLVAGPILGVVHGCLVGGNPLGAGITGMVLGFLFALLGGVAGFAATLTVGGDVEKTSWHARLLVAFVGPLALFCLGFPILFSLLFAMGAPLFQNGGPPGDGIIAQRAPTWAIVTLTGCSLGTICLVWLIVAGMRREFANFFLYLVGGALFLTVLVVALAGYFLPSLQSQVLLRQDSVELIDYGPYWSSQTQRTELARMWGTDTPRRPDGTRQVMVAPYWDPVTGAPDRLMMPADLFSQSQPFLFASLLARPNPLHPEEEDLYQLTFWREQSSIEYILYNRLVVVRTWSESPPVMHRPASVKYHYPLTEESWEVVRASLVGEWPPAKEMGLQKRGGIGRFASWFGRTIHRQGWAKPILTNHTPEETPWPRICAMLSVVASRPLPRGGFREEMVRAAEQLGERVPELKDRLIVWDHIRKNQLFLELLGDVGPVEE